MNTTGAEQRQCPRVGFEGRALIPPDGRATFTPCEPRNVSEGGVCLRLEEDMELRSEVDIQLLAANLTQPIQCHGRVNGTTARRDVRAQPPIPYDVGIEFVGLSPQLRAQLQRAVQDFRQRSVLPPASRPPIL